MKEEVKNAGETTDNTKKAEIAQRSPDSEVLYVGCKDALAVDLIKSVLGEKFKVFVLNKAIFNNVTEQLIKAHVKWEEEQKIVEYTKEAKNMHECLKIAKNVEDKVGVDTWFSLSKFIEETSFTYKHAHSTMDLLFAFGFLAHDTKNNKYKIVADPRIKLKYVDEIIEDITKELGKLTKVKEMITSGVEEAELAISEVMKERIAEKTSKEVSSENEAKVVALNVENTTEKSIESNSEGETNNTPNTESTN